MATLGIDYGSRRIGIAVSASDVLATPLTVVPNCGDLGETVERIARLADEIGSVETFVVGIPRSSRRDAAETERKFRELAEALRQKTCKEVVLWDESYSTTEAASRRRESGKNWKSMKAEIDKEAAAVILQSYLDEQSRKRS